jgi:hypothetical protein
LPNTSGGTPFSCFNCPNVAHKIRTIQTLHTNALPIMGGRRRTLLNLPVYCALINSRTMCVHTLYDCTNVQMYKLYSVQYIVCIVCTLCTN